MTKKLSILIFVLVVLIPVNFGAGIFIGTKLGINKQKEESVKDIQNLGPYYLPKEAIVIKVVDGDTIEITAVETPRGWQADPKQIQGGSRDSPEVKDMMPTRTVRYLGIDAPNLGKPGFNEAKAYNEKLVLGKKITLEYDTPQDDKYGRILAWIWLDGKLINKEMITSGLTKPYLMESQTLKYNFNN